MLARVLAVIALVGPVGCAIDAPDAAPRAENTLEITVAALTLPGITDACYNLNVTNGLGDTVVARDGLCSDAFGDGQGAISFVAPCDASATASANTVTLELVDLFADEPPTALVDGVDYDNPCPVGGATCQITETCVANADVQVAFDIAVMRAANQGFFDVAVNFSDIFCSAKFDCAVGDILHNPATGQRDTTAVLALACTAGPGQDTVLNMNDVVIDCQGPNATTVVLDPTLGPGNFYTAASPSPDPLLFQAASYLGEEQLPGLNKCYWNLALGLDLAGGGYQNCTVQTTATATDGTLVASQGATPQGTVWPYIAFDIPLTDASGDLSCGAHALNAGVEVQTLYSTTSGETFCHYMDCQPAGGELTVGSQCATPSGVCADPNAFTDTFAYADGPLPSPWEPLSEFPTGPLPEVIAQQACVAVEAGESFAVTELVDGCLSLQGLVTFTSDFVFDKQGQEFDLRQNLASTFPSGGAAYGGAVRKLFAGQNPTVHIYENFSETEYAVSAPFVLDPAVVYQMETTFDFGTSTITVRILSGGALVDPNATVSHTDAAIFSGLGATPRVNLYMEPGIVSGETVLGDLLCIDNLSVIVTP